MNHIYQHIKDNQSIFTKGLKKVANRLFEHPKLFAMNSATEVGKQVGVSETTVIRFCHEIGYEGFSALQADVRKTLFKKNNLSEYLEAKIGEIPKNNSIKNTMKSDIDNIVDLLDYISEDDLNRVVLTLSEADKILVSGLRSSHSLASWFAFSLNLIISKTYLYQPHIDEMQLRLNEFSTESLLVVFSFHRYAEETIKLAKLAKQQGIFVIAFTDSPVSPITEIADISLSLQLKVKSIFDAAPVVFSLMNSIITALSIENKELFKERAKKFYLTNTDDLKK